MIEHVAGSVDTPCPFCTGTFGPMYDPETREPLGLFHSMPMCETFERLSPLDFVSAARAAMQTPEGQA